MRKSPGLRYRSFQNQTVQTDSCPGVHVSLLSTSQLSGRYDLGRGGVQLTPLPCETSVHGAAAAGSTPSAFSCLCGTRSFLTPKASNCALVSQADPGFFFFCF